MRKKTIIIRHKGEKVKYRYSISKGGNARSIHMERNDGYGEIDEFNVMIAKTDWYCIAFPDMGTASIAYSALDYGTVADAVHDAGHYEPDTEAITLAIMDIINSGF